VRNEAAVEMAAAIGSGTQRVPEISKADMSGVILSVASESSISSAGLGAADAAGNGFSDRLGSEEAARGRLGSRLEERRPSTR